MKITAADVNKLRQTSGAGMMDCKKALQEANGNFDEAILILRKKGQKISEKRADRSASEGVLVSRTSNDSALGILVALNCETDFVAKNEDFVTFANKIADLAIEQTPDSLDALKAMELDGSSIQEQLTNYTGKIGEKIDISSYTVLKGASVVPYVHSNNKLGVLVALNKPVNDAISGAGRDVAMQIASMKPIAVNRSQVDQSIVDREIALGKEKALKEGKPAQIVDRIAEGMLNKFFKENTLLDQQFVKDSSQTVQNMLQAIESGLTVNDFKRVELA